MSAITVRNLGKRYKLGATLEAETLGEQISRLGRRMLGKAAPKQNKSGELWALRDINFAVEQGQVLGIIGHNGAGKSTLLKLLSQITEPTEGEIRVRGRIASLLEVGTGFHPELSGRENIYMNGAILGMKKAEIDKKFDEIVEFAQVRQFLSTPVKRYSSGMTVRLAFAIAAHLEPEILLVDEVLAVGDAEFQKKCLGKMEDVANTDGRTILFVSHNMTAVRNLCGQVMHIRQGRVSGIGDVDSMIAEYFSVAGRGAIDEAAGTGVELGGLMQLTDFSFTPNPIDSNQPLHFRIEVVTAKDLTLNDFVILLYNSLGARAGIIDLRKQHEAYRTRHGEPLVIEGQVHAVPLVEGDYKIGLYLNCIEYYQDFKDLATLTVSHRVKAGHALPREVRHRGIVEFDYSFNAVSGNHPA